jgi:hypothetical protein
MKGFIRGIPYIIPCADCAEHAKSFIERHESKLDSITSGRDNLFNFFVDFHNYVNERYGKATLSYSEASKLYSGKAKTLKMTYY